MSTKKKKVTKLPKAKDEEVVKKTTREFDLISVHDGAPIWSSQIIRKYAGNRADYDVAIRKNRIVFSGAFLGRVKLKTGDPIVIAPYGEKLYIATKPKTISSGFKLGKSDKYGSISITSNVFTENLQGDYYLEQAVITEKIKDVRNVVVGVYWWSFERR